MNSIQSGLMISSRHWALMEADVAARSAEEACGLVLGEGSESKLIIPVTNILHDAHRFRMDPHEELDAFVLAEKNEWEIIAIYHSHPYGINHPSSTDYHELTFPGTVYLIWYQHANEWQCRGYLMQSAAESVEIPLVISTKEQL